MDQTTKIMKYLTLSALFMLMQATFCIAIEKTKINSKLNGTQQDSLTVYIGKYQMIQGVQTVYANVYVENGKLSAKSSDGQTLIFDHISGDNFVVSNHGVPIKFLRDKNYKVKQISVNGNVAWTKVESTLPDSIKPLAPQDYLGKYQFTTNGQTLYLEITLKDGHLSGTQLWDGATKPLDYVWDDNFKLRDIGWPIKFIRDKDKKVTQLLINNTDLFIKVKN
ncbi:MAG: hypothetical protein JWQ84_2969 [Mucilaginibacter sp.]|nr:hypothetical protein [Mucilaginibacter sp.]